MTLNLITLLSSYTSFLFFLATFISGFINWKWSKNSFKYALFFLSITLITFGQYMLEIYPKTGYEIILWHKFRLSGAIFLMLSFPLAIRSFINIKMKNSYLYFLAATSLALLTGLLFTKLIISKEIIKYVNIYQGQPGSLFVVFQIAISGILIYECIHLLRFYYKNTKKKKHINLLLFGIGIGIITGFYDIFGNLFNNILPSIPSLFTYGVFITAILFATAFFTRFFQVRFQLQKDESRIQKLLDKSKMETFELLELIASTIEARDTYTAGHSERVTEYALEIAKILRLSEKEKQLIKNACQVHDIGKIGVSDLILNKPDRLTLKELYEIRKHPEIGMGILSHFHYFVRIIPYIYFHHERIDGKGYPKGLKGNKIPLIARIIAIADTFDAITSDRPYRKAMPIKKAIKILDTVKGSQLDTIVVEKFPGHLKDKYSAELN